LSVGVSLRFSVVAKLPAAQPNIPDRHSSFD
jgi:hypothetical protein